MRVENKKARFEYEVIETFEAGLILTGPEVKSIKAGQVNLTGARVIEKDGRLFVVGMSVPKYQFTTDPEYDPGATFPQKGNNLDFVEKGGSWVDFGGPFDV